MNSQGGSFTIARPPHGAEMVMDTPEPVIGRLPHG